jgi:hypothetical protein
MEPLTLETAFTVAFFSLACGGFFLPIWIVAKLTLW